jgi:hypothetical protein
MGLGTAQVAARLRERTLTVRVAGTAMSSASVRPRSVWVVCATSWRDSVEVKFDSCTYRGPGDQPVQRNDAHAVQRPVTPGADGRHGFRRRPRWSDSRNATRRFPGWGQSHGGLTLPADTWRCRVRPSPPRCDRSVVARPDRAGS